jgi:hypothetical protein
MPTRNQKESRPWLNWEKNNGEPQEILLKIDKEDVTTKWYHWVEDNVEGGQRKPMVPCPGPADCQFAHDSRETKARPRNYLDVIQVLNGKDEKKVFAFGNTILREMESIQDTVTKMGRPWKGTVLKIVRTGKGLETRYDVKLARAADELGVGLDKKDDDTDPYTIVKNVIKTGNAKISKANVKKVITNLVDKGYAVTTDQTDDFYTRLVAEED